MLGPSGCGKTTTLRMIAGFEEVTDGRLTIDDADMLGIPPHKRPTNTVFQSYALFPHLSVKENVAFGLKRKGVDKERDRPAGPRGARARRARRRGEPPAGPALGRDAAARRARPRPGQPAARPAARRAARRARPEAPQGPAGGAQEDPAGGRDHLRLRHPRPGGGADHVRPDRGDEPRPDRADRRSRGGLRPPHHDLRRRLHRRLQPDAGGDPQDRREGRGRAGRRGQGDDRRRRLLRRRALPRRRAAGEARDRRGRPRATRASRGWSRAPSTSARRPS